MELALTINIRGGIELWDESREIFLRSEAKTVELHHNLISISLWESKWKKPFLKNEEKTQKELKDYISCMSYRTLTDVDLACLTRDQIAEINKFIADDKTATTITKQEGSSSRGGEIMSSELLYYYMFSCGIPKECETWHLGRLLMLISVFGEKNKPQKNMGTNALLARNKSLNDARRAKRGGRG